VDASRISNGRRPLIAILGGWLDDIYLNEIRKGVVARAAELDVSLVFFAGGQLGDPARNALYDLVTGDQPDGLIIVGSILSGHDDTILLDTFYERFKGIPRVSIGHPMEGIPSVLVDNHTGMYHAVEHLIVEHGCRHPLLVAGPETNHH
jgi:sigma-B regulation protein RsbU (phosphoserine phosphatase)